MARGIQVFVSYARRDKHLWQELKYHLHPFLEQGLITLYDPHNTIDRAGMDWQELHRSHLGSAQLILLLISPYYLASDFLRNFEMKRALDRHIAGEAIVLPILLSPVYWQDEPFSKLQLFPANQRPITLWRKKSAAFLQVAIGIRDVIDQLLSSPDAKVIRAWISERIAAPREPLFVNETYTLNLHMVHVGPSSSIAEPHGLDTGWIVYSSSVEFETPTNSITDDSDTGGSSFARFTLFIPDRRDSSIQQLRITPKSQGNIHISALIYAHGELYRDFQIELAVAKSTTHFPSNTDKIPVDTESPTTPLLEKNVAPIDTESLTTPSLDTDKILGGPEPPITLPLEIDVVPENAEAPPTFPLDTGRVPENAEAPTPPPLGTNVIFVKKSIIHTPAIQLSLLSHYNWQQPPEELQIVVLTHKDVFVNGSDVAINGALIDWRGSKENIAGKIRIVRQRAEAFQAAASLSTYIDNIDSEDLLSRLEHFKPQSDWTMLHDESDDDHQQAWSDMQEDSQELRNLAICGYDLYNTCFPKNTTLRIWLDGLKRGCHLSIHWTQKSDASPSSIPWGLMYVQDPDLPIDPFCFLGLRFRIHYTAYDTEYTAEQTRDRSKALGHPDKVHRGNCLYWGTQWQPATLAGAKWQRSVWADWPNHIFIPDNQENPDQEPKPALLKLLKSPEANQPLPLLYFYCKCSLEDETGAATLSFALDSGTITHEDLIGMKLVDRPFVFMNACTTSAADPYIGNSLQSLFFSKGCSAYLGTETKVPSMFASRFAVIFFHFFYRKIKEWPEPISLGEALAQTKLFLWTNYKNIGGILYTCINQSQLFMADAEELEKLRP